MNKLILENFRCFRGRQEVPIRPLTLLVGENSTGKTSFLAAVRLAYDLGTGSIGLNFNEEPFELGSFREIAAHGSGRKGNAISFSIGYEGLATATTEASLPIESTLLATFRKNPGKSQPEESGWALTYKPYSFSIFDEGSEGTDDKILRIVSVKTASGEYKGESTFNLKRIIAKGELGSLSLGPFGNVLRFQVPIIEAFFQPEQDQSSLRKKKPNAPPELEFDFVQDLQPPMSFPTRPLALAPIRSKPSRTIDVLRETFQPTGEHIVAVLAELKASGSSEGKKLMTELAKFGVECGLFQSIDIKQLGGNESGAFRQVVKIGGHAENIVDVGYGVSQVLPILVDALRGSKEQTYLLQQPEVHLHPRAQAQLGSLFGMLAKRDKKTFIVETHSDYIVDRVRLDIQKKKEGFLSPEDVVILYFERNNGEVKIYPIEIDEMGNISGQPPTFRKFFLDEERAFLGL